MQVARALETRRSRSVRHCVDFPPNRLGREDGTVGANPLVCTVRERPVSLDRHDAAYTYTEAAAHRRFERDKALHVELGGCIGNTSHHRPRSAGIDHCARTSGLAKPMLERHRNKTFLPEAPIVCRQCEWNTKSTKVVKSATNCVTFGCRAEKHLRVDSRPFEFLTKREHRGRANTPCDYDCVPSVRLFDRPTV